MAEPRTPDNAIPKAASTIPVGAKKNSNQAGGVEEPAPHPQAPNGGPNNAKKRKSQSAWMASQAWRSGEPFRYPIPNNGDPWQKCSQLVLDYDDAKCSRWKEEVQNLLIFAGLFSAVVTAFAVETQRYLQEDPDVTAALLLLHMAMRLDNTTAPPMSTTLVPFSVTPRAIRMNVLMFISLVLSLATVLFGILGLQWLREFQRKENTSHQEILLVRHVRYEGFLKWRVPQLLSLLPVLLLSALVLFFGGLIDFLFSLEAAVAVAVGIVICIILIALIATTILPTLQGLFRLMGYGHPGAQCPYKSPQSWAFFRLVFNPLAFFYRRSRKFRSDDELVVSTSAFENLGQLAVSPNWSQYDKIYLMHQGIDIDTPLSWIARTFTRNVSSVATIYHCFRDIDVWKAWRAYWAIEGVEGDFLNKVPAQEDTELLRDLVSEALLDHLTRKTELRHTPSLMLHRIELYNRIMMSTEAVGDPIKMSCAGAYEPSCPDMSWFEFGVFNGPDLPHDIQIQTLNCLLSVITRKKTVEHSDMYAIWNLVYRFLRHSSIPDDILHSIFDDTFTKLELRMKSSKSSDNPYADARYISANAFFHQIIYPFLYENTANNPQFQSHLKDMASNTSFLRCLAEMMKDPESFIDYYTGWQEDGWKRFVTICNLDSQYSIPKN